MNNVIKKSSAGIHVLPIDSVICEQNRVITIEGEINTEMANSICKQIIYLSQMNREEPIKVIIFSNGGEVTAGHCIYDMFTTCGIPIHTYCIGAAYSMAGVLFAAGTRRFILENAEVMLHEPLINSGRFSGSTSSVKSISDNMLAVKAKLCKILAKHTGKTEGEISEAISYDHYFSAQEAIDFGLADEIVPFSTILQ